MARDSKVLSTSINDSSYLAPVDQKLTFCCLQYNKDWVVRYSRVVAALKLFTAPELSFFAAPTISTPHTQERDERPYQNFPTIIATKVSVH